MNKPRLEDLPERYQAQARAQLAGLAHPRTIAIEPAPHLPVKPARSPKLPAKRPDYDATPLFRSMGFPAPVREYRFYPDRMWRFDYAWIAQKVALEVQGGIWTRGRHTRGAALLKEWEKLNTAAAMGWRVLYCQPTEIAHPSTYNAIGKALDIVPLVRTHGGDHCESAGHHGE